MTFGLDVSVLATLLGGMWLFHRWKETGDRSAYIVALLLIWMSVVVTLRILAADVQVLITDGFAVAPIEPTWVAWVAAGTGWFGTLAGFVFLAFMARAFALSRFFLLASQQAIRNQYHRIETSWQYAAGVFGATLGIRVVVGWVLSYVDVSPTPMPFIGS